MSGSSTGGTVLAAAVARLAAAGVAEPATDARRLLAHALELAPDRLALALPEPLPGPVAARFAALVDARATRQPVAQITGRRLFWGYSFRVSADVLDPRPESETLIAAALEAPFSRVLDLGTGSGCLLLTLLAERPDATGIGTDVSAPALTVAADNAARLGLADRAEFHRANWFDGIAGVFDLIVSNPPYLAEAEIAALEPEVRDWEPRQALTAGGDGLAAYRAIAAGAGPHLAPGARLLLEIGPRQGAAVREVVQAAGLGPVTVREDLDGRARVLICGPRVG